jgi:phosphoserine phosphatase
MDVKAREAGLSPRYSLIALDMDMTLVPVETLVVLARARGCGPEVARITARAMAGEIDFRRALARRVALLRGMEAREVARLARGLRPRPGAADAVREFRRRGLSVALVTGGFHEVADPVARRLGITDVAANTLEVRKGRLTGRVRGSVQTPGAKARALRDLARRTGTDLARTIAVGDGANDVPMLRAAGLSIAFGRNPKVARVARAGVPDRSFRRLATVVRRACDGSN